MVEHSREVAQRNAGEEAAQRSTLSPYCLTWSPAQQGCLNGALQWLLSDKRYSKSTLNMYRQEQFDFLKEVKTGM